MWQKSGRSPATGARHDERGNLVFVGRNDGQYQAYDATTGKLLWSFQTGAGANDAARSSRTDGKENIALLAAGNSLDGDVAR